MPSLTKKICSVDGCDRKYKAKGYCWGHYEKFLLKRVRPILYPKWISMKDRCGNSNHSAYSYYGGRGITVCERWLHSYQNFEDDMLPTYQPGLTIDRIDNTLGYSKENCRWATWSEQSTNKRTRKDNTSGYTGVGWYKPSQKWIVRYGDKYVGYFNTKEEAIAKRKELEKYT